MMKRDDADELKDIVFGLGINLACLRDRLDDAARYLDMVKKDYASIKAFMASSQKPEPEPAPLQCLSLGGSVCRVGTPEIKGIIVGAERVNIGSKSECLVYCVRWLGPRDQPEHSKHLADDLRAVTTCDRPFSLGDAVRHAPSGMTGVVCGLRDGEADWACAGVVYVTVFRDLLHVRP